MVKAMLLVVLDPAMFPDLLVEFSVVVSSLPGVCVQPLDLGSSYSESLLWGALYGVPLEVSFPGKVPRFCILATH